MHPADVWPGARPDGAGHSVSAPTLEQRDGEVGRVAFGRAGRRNDRRVWITLDRLAIEVPAGMTEQRDDHGEPEEERQ